MTPEGQRKKEVFAARFVLDIEIPIQGVPGIARAVAHAQAVGAATKQPYQEVAEDPGVRQCQARLSVQRR